MVSVTHDVEEAFRLQAEVVILRDGRIHDEGYVSKVLPKNALASSTPCASNDTRPCTNPRTHSLALTQ